MTAAANLFPQALHTPQAASLELPLPYDTTLTMNSGLGFFAMANYNLNLNNNNVSTDTNIDYHSSDHIFDHFNATFGSLDGAY